MNTENKTLGIEETMQRLGIKSKRTLYRLIHDGEIRPIPAPPFFKRRPRLEFTEQEVERVLKGEPLVDAA